jgi:hypothetical protein
VDARDKRGHDDLIKYHPALSRDDARPAAPAINWRRLTRLEKIRCCILGARAIAIAQHIGWIL